jgi:hypothetical protein
MGKPNDGRIPSSQPLRSKQTTDPLAPAAAHALRHLKRMEVNPMHHSTTPFGARVPALPSAKRRAAPLWQFNAVAIGLGAIVTLSILAPLSLYLAGSRLVEIEARLAADARV